MVHLLMLSSGGTTAATVHTQSMGQTQARGGDDWLHLKVIAAFAPYTERSDDYTYAQIFSEPFR